MVDKVYPAKKCSEFRWEYSECFNNIFQILKYKEHIQNLMVIFYNRIISLYRM